MYIDDQTHLAVLTSEIKCLKARIQKGLIRIKEAKNLIEEITQSYEEKAKGYEQLERLLGNWQDGSDTKIQLYQDECTRTFHLDCYITSIHKKAYYGASLPEVIGKAYNDLHGV